MSIARDLGLGGEFSGWRQRQRIAKAGGCRVKTSETKQGGAQSGLWRRIRRSWSWGTTVKLAVVLVFLVVDIVLFFGTGRDASDSAASPGSDRAGGIAASTAATVATARATARATAPGRSSSKATARTSAPSARRVDAPVR